MIPAAPLTILLYHISAKMENQYDRIKIKEELQLTLYSNVLKFAYRNSKL